MNSKKVPRGRPRKAKAQKKRGVTLFLAPEMIDRLDQLKESLGISARNDMIRMLIQTHPDYREQAQ